MLSAADSPLETRDGKGCREIPNPPQSSPRLDPEPQPFRIQTRCVPTDPHRRPGAGFNPLIGQSYANTANPVALHSLTVP